MARLGPEFVARGVKVIGLSVDSVESHLRWEDDVAETQGTPVDFPMIADVNPPRPTRSPRPRTGSPAMT